MKEYKVTYRETLVHTFYVCADDEDEARVTFNARVNEGLIDFSDGEVTETEINISELDHAKEGCEAIPYVYSGGT